jgi:polysaccharide pyruvyl transferase WcaK-like protein
MTKNTKKEPILLLGAYGRGNAGDDVFTICAAELFGDYEIYINSAHDFLLPDAVKGKIHTISTVNAKDTLQKIRLIFSIKKVVYWGGDLWVELYGTKTPRQLLYKMIVLNLLLRLMGKRVYYIGCGIGALEGYSLWLARTSARMAKKVVVREQRSADVLGVPNIAVLPDLAVNLPYNRPVRHKRAPDQPFSIVVSVLHSIPSPSDNFPKLIAEIAGLIDSLPSKKYKVTVLPMQISDKEHNDDLWASKELLKAITKHKNVDIWTDQNLEAIVGLLRDSHLVIGGRLHANILAIFNGTPAIGISYRPKINSFFKEFGLDEYSLELNEIAQLKEKFEKVYNDYDMVAERFYAVSRQAYDSRQDYQRLVKEID